MCLLLQEENFDEAAKAAFHAWTPYIIRKYCLLVHTNTIVDTNVL